MKKQRIVPSFWAVIPANVRYDKNISSTAKLLFAEITALSNIEGYCWASNNYFAELFGITETQVSRIVSSLNQRGFIKSFVSSVDGNLRKIYPQITADGVEKENTINKTFEQRFDEAIGVIPFELKEEKQAFVDWWTAKNDRGKKEHWQKQKTFSIKQRWSTWIRNTKKWQKNEKLPSDAEIRRKEKAEIRRKEIEQEREEENKAISRTPEEQLAVDNKLKEIREKLKNKFRIK